MLFHFEAVCNFRPVVTGTVFQVILEHFDFMNVRCHLLVKVQRASDLVAFQEGDNFLTLSVGHATDHHLLFSGFFINFGSSLLLLGSFNG